MEPRFGEQYRVWIGGEPVPKSTMKPPIIRKPMNARYRAMLVKKIIATDPKYAPLQKTQDYQHYVATSVWSAIDEFPQFDELDPIKLTMTFLKGKHATGDLKNLIAAVEDGIQHSARIPNDRQVTAHGESRIYYYNSHPGVSVVAEIDPLASNYEWLLGWLNNSKKKTERYIAMREIVVK